LVPTDGNAALYGDEAVLMRRRLQCSVAVAADRLKAVSMLIDEGCDIVVSDEGLQHYAMERDIEIAVVDGARGLGNGRLMPAGPLREPRSRLEVVDWVVSNGCQTGLRADEIIMHAKALDFVNVATGLALSAEDFLSKNKSVHALCGIGNPLRFMHSLQSLGLSADLREFPDPHDYSGEEVVFADALPVVCTENDAVKLRELELDLVHVWALRMELSFDDDISSSLDLLLLDKGLAPRSERLGLG
jgi:tetraacyldisaccharide 4'-kinase